MRSQQFFRKVWRFNALVILLAGTLGVGMLAVTAFYALHAMFRERQVTAVVNTEGQQQIQESLSLGRATQITGHPWLLAEPDKPTAVVSFVVVQGDSDGDKRLTPSDLSSLVFAKPDGTQSKTVLENVRRVVSQEMIGEDVVVLYEGASGYGKAVVSSTDFSRVAGEPFELPKAS